MAQWWFEVLDEGAITKETGFFSRKETPLWPSQILKDDAHNLYVLWATRQKVTHIETKATVTRFLKNWGVTAHRLRDQNSELKQFYVLPNIEPARKLFSEAFGLPSHALLGVEI